jgi:glucose-1-phosphate cytidylyltransferase
MRTLILCGGKGTRAYPHTIDVPKPLLEVAGRPIVLHLMEIYAAQGFRDFVLACGSNIDAFHDFVAGLDSSWNIDVVDTGEDADTGERVVRCRERVGDTFFLTYGDGVGNVDLHELLAFHTAHDGAATITAVPLPSQYGTLELDDSGRVRHFREKPVLTDHLINAGFMVMDQRVFHDWRGSSLEVDALPALGAANELFAYRHNGFWRSMDTYKDAVDLTTLCEAGAPPPWLTTPSEEKGAVSD